MASVPGPYIKDKFVDFNGELFQFFDHPARMGGLRVPPLTVGVWSVLEMIDSVFIKSPRDAAIIDVWRALYVICNREAALDGLDDFLAAKGPENAFNKDNVAPWDAKVIKWASGSDIDISEESNQKLLNWIWLSFSGYEMIPPMGGAGGGAHWFAADGVAAVVALACKNLNCSMFEAIWRVPLCAVGHILAQNIKSSCSKITVARPKDPADIKKKLAECNERERLGQLHPWQMVYGKFYPVSKAQKDANPGIVAEFEECKKRLKEIGENAMLAELKEKGLVDV